MKVEEAESIRKEPETEKVRDLLGSKTDQVWLNMQLYLKDRYCMEVLWNNRIKNAVYECKFKITGQTLCSFYMNEGKLDCLIILGKKERDAFELQRALYSESFLKIYDETQTYHDGKWIYFCINEEPLIHDAKQLIGMKKKPNSKLSSCGYCCARCKAYVKNYTRQDERADISRVWQKYYGFYLAPEDCSCDGCKSTKKGAKRLDSGCCVNECSCMKDKSVEYCYECRQFPCNSFLQRKGLSQEEAEKELGEQFSREEYEQYLETFDNLSRTTRLRKEYLDNQK